MIHLDTHVVVWLLAGQLDRFGAHALHLLKRDALFISPMVLLELDYLHEIGRASKDAGAVLAELVVRLQLRVTDVPWAVAAVEARSLTFTRDPFDRLICASAVVDGCPLLTADRTILDAFDLAVWD